MALTIVSESTPAVARVSVRGEVDVSNADELRDALDAALSADSAEVVVDLSEMPYIDSTGIGVLVGVAHRAADAARGFSLERPQRNVERVIGMLGLRGDLGLGDERGDVA